MNKLCKSFFVFLLLHSAACFSSEETVVVDQSQYQQAKRLMQWLGISKATHQADRTIELSLQILGVEQQFSAEQFSKLKTQLHNKTGSAALTAAVASYVSQHLPPEIEQLERALGEPLPARVRNFEVGMDMQGAIEKFERYRKKNNDVEPHRQALIQQLDRLLRVSQFAALIQTEIEITTAYSAAQLRKEPRPLIDYLLKESEQRQRQQQLSALVNELNLYGYRFMKDNELEAYVALLKTKQLQAFIDVSWQAVEQSLAHGREQVLVTVQ